MGHQKLSTNQNLLIIVFSTSILVGSIEKEIQLDEVPSIVLDAAKKAVPGIKLIEAEMEKTGEGLIYEVEGVLDGIEYEIEISLEGKVLEIEDDDEIENEDDHQDKNKVDLLITGEFIRYWISDNCYTISGMTIML